MRPFKILPGTTTAGVLPALFLAVQLSAAELPVVTGIEWQPFAAQVKRLIEATDYLGSPFSVSDKAALEATLAGPGTDAAAGQVQSLLDRYCLYGVDINPEMRVKVVDRLSSKTIGDFMRSNIAFGSTLNTDGNPFYRTAYLPRIKHESVNHSAGEMQRERADGSKVHVNSCESFFSLLKRGVTGAFHHISKEHLPRYCDEFAFRWNTRKLTDGERFEVAITMIEGKRLKYRETILCAP